jgi:peptidoglycan/xylan/chitin deacetylase (PgdA/CDA1 family)
MNEGIEFGGHSRTHPELDHISDSAIEEEVVGSRAELEEICGTAAVSFAYPYGNYNRVVEEIVGRSFRLAFTTEEGLNHLGTDRFRLLRTMVQPHDSLLDFASRLQFGFSIVQETKAAIRRRILPE